MTTETTVPLNGYSYVVRTETDASVIKTRRNGAEYQQRITSPPKLRKLWKLAAAVARGKHYGTTQPGVQDEHLKLEAATLYGSTDEQAAFIAGFKTATAKLTTETTR